MRKQQISEEHKRKVENEQLDRINIQRGYSDAISSLRDYEIFDLQQKNAIVGVSYELLVTALLNGYRDVSVEEIKDRFGLDSYMASVVRSLQLSFRDIIIGTRSAMIGGSEKKKPSTTKPSDNLPDALKGEDEY